MADTRMGYWDTRFSKATEEEEHSLPEIVYKPFWRSTDRIPFTMGIY